MICQNFSLHETTFNPESYEDFFHVSLKNTEFIKNNKKQEILNTSCAFDIETSSFRIFGKDKQAIMYSWALGINGYVMIGRKWDEFITVYNKLIEYLGLCADRFIIIYIHNLSYEFQFLRKRFEWDRVFSLNEREPVEAVTKQNVIFRCSFLLSGYKLEKISDQLLTYKIEKLVGDLDYDKPRNSETPLTEKELKYITNDVLVVMAYIQEKIEIDGNITRIPLTKTGYVRKACRRACFYGFDSKLHQKGEGQHFQRYRNFISKLTLEPEEYVQLKRAFMGGFTHANAFMVNQDINNVRSYDFISSYPAVMVSEKFPMSKGKVVKPTMKEFENYLSTKCCMFDIEFENIEATQISDNPISYSKCWNVQNEIINNGRIVSADHLITTVTEQDFFIYKMFYKWKSFKIANFTIYDKAYLPQDFIKVVIKFYEDKTKLKGVAGKELEYLNAKEMLNALYGMMVTDICRDEFIYNSEWDKQKVDIVEAIKIYNNTKNRFLFYPWGVWVTAYARRNLFTAIYEYNTDYIYSDTDSVKVINSEKHLEYIKKYNEHITNKIKKSMEYNNIDFEKTRPFTIKGKQKPLGIWDDEGTYDKFKTLGAKRYMTEKNGELSITVSGVNKDKTVPYLLNKYKDRVFEKFVNGIEIPPEFTGKLTHTYIDIPQDGILTDYLGNTAEYHELSSVHLEAAKYKLSLTAEFMNYILGITERLR